MSMSRSGSMVIIVNVKLHTISCKGSGILNCVFHTIHYYLSANRHKWIGSIYSNGMVCSWICTTSSWSSGPYTTTDSTVTISTGHYLSQWFSDSNISGFCHRFCSTFRIQMILCFKKSLQFIFNIWVRPVPIFCGKIRDKMVWIMANLSNVVLILVIIRMSSFHLINLLVQGTFQSSISVFGSIDILVWTWIRCNTDHRSSTLDRSTAAPQRYRYDKKKKRKNTDACEHGTITLYNLFQGNLCFYRHVLDTGNGCRST